MHPSARRLRDAREAAGIARDVLGRSIGKAPKTMERWETLGIPNADALLQLARELGQPLEHLLGANDGPRRRRGERRR